MSKGQEDNYRGNVKRRERIYPKEEAEDLMKEKCGKARFADRTRKGRLPKLDKRVMGNFFGRLKVEMFCGEKFESVHPFIDRLKVYIRYCNSDRISAKLKGMSPVQYRIHSQSI